MSPGVSIGRLSGNVSHILGDPLESVKAACRAAVGVVGRGVIQ
jgi:hypothetical protein